MGEQHNLATLGWDPLLHRGDEGGSGCLLRKKGQGGGEAGDRGGGRLGHSACGGSPLLSCQGALGVWTMGAALFADREREAQDGWAWPNISERGWCQGPDGTPELQCWVLGTNNGVPYA